MGEKKRDILDDIIDGIRQIIEDLDKVLRPDKQRKPVPVPVPVRIRPDRREQNRYYPR